MIHEYKDQPPETRRLWRLQDAIEAGALSKEQLRCLSKIVGWAAMSPEPFGADALWPGVQKAYQELINVTEGEK